jgi:hypothetical protein
VITETVNWTELLERLAEPFAAEAVQWRAGATTRDRKRAQALPYADPRLYEDRLNAVCPGDWQVAFKPWGESKLICELTIHGVTRASTGEFDDSDRVSQGPTAEAQAFKRACSKFGLGRYLYDIDIRWVDYDEEKRRLLEHPTLPQRYRPQAATPTPPSAPAATPAAEAPAADAPAGDHLSPERADAMQRELEKLNVARDEQRSFVAAILGRRVRSLAELTEDEALEVWNAAKRNQQDLAL